MGGVVVGEEQAVTAIEQRRRVGDAAGDEFVLDPGFAWNHGGVLTEINTTFLGLVGPGIAQQGIQDAVWSDHTDVRPTMLLLTGLKDDYAHQGRALVEALKDNALPMALLSSGSNFILLGGGLQADHGTSREAWPRKPACVDQSAGWRRPDLLQVGNELAALTDQRDTLAAQIIQLLEDAEFNRKPLDSRTTAKLVKQAAQLLNEVEELQEGD